MQLASWRARAALAGALLVTFYAGTVALALFLVAIPLALDRLEARGLWRTGGGPNGTLFVYAIAWVPAALLLRGLVRRVPRREAPGRPLAAHEAPALFAMLAELARGAGIAGPDEIWLTDQPTAAVTERGGVLGFGSRRVLRIGLPLLAVLDTTELRAVLAHELGHFLGGDTRLAGVVTHTHALFVALTHPTPHANAGHPILEIGIQAANALSTAIARLYARIYLALTRATDRQRELEADAFAARLTSGPSLARALEKVVVVDATYPRYLHANVVRAVAAGAVPRDLLDGFRRAAARFEDRGIAAEALTHALAAATDPFDTHPPLAERLARLARLAPAPTPAPPALSLLAFDPRGWLEQRLRDDLGVPSLPALGWNEIEAGVFAPWLETRGAAARMQLASFHPAPGFATLHDVLVQGQGEALACAFAPPLGALVPAVRARLVPETLISLFTTLFVAALLEAGATVAGLLGEDDFVLVYRGERVEPSRVVRAALTSDHGRAPLAAWANALRPAL